MKESIVGYIGVGSFNRGKKKGLNTKVMMKNVFK